MNPLQPIPTGIHLRPDNSRVLARHFIPADRSSRLGIIERALALTEEETAGRLALLRAQFGDRHPRLEPAWQRAYAQVARHVPREGSLSPARRHYIGALFSGEYALESAALFNPSMVPHPDQRGLAEGALRFILSLRATGEGHISSITFRTGVIEPDHTVAIDKPGRHVSAPDLNPDPSFRRHSFASHLREMGFDNQCSRQLLEALGERFTRSELNAALHAATGGRPATREARRTADCVRWLAEVNYEVHFDPATPLDARVIFPVSPTESNGMEDARFVRFTDADGSATYYATYTAYNGRKTLPQLLETSDFLGFRSVTLSGGVVRNKGMAMFPRRLGGRYVMLGRPDDENLHLLTSDDPHRWGEAELLRQPREAWEAVKIGNCGSPIETAAGWLVLTHGVGPMRRYCIGAMLLDRDDPSRVLGHLPAPLIEPAEPLRNGYVPNVVYSCGGLVHRGRLFIPYGLSDTSTTIAMVDLDRVLGAINGGGGPAGRNFRLGGGRRGG